MDELWRRLRLFSTRTAAIPADERGSFEWLAAAGVFWWEARERAGLSRAAAATQLGIPEMQLRFLEFGLVTPRELTAQRLHEYARILGDPELYAQFQCRFEP